MNPREIQNYMTRPPELEILVSKNFRSGEKTVMLSEQEQKLTELARNQTLATLSKLELSELSIIASFLLYLKTQREPEEHIKTVLRQPMLQLLLVIISVILLLVPADECLHIFGSAESKLLKELANVQPSESKLLPFLYKQQSSQLTLCELKKQLLKEIQSSADDIKDQKLLVRELSTNYKNPDQRLTSRARAKKIKIKEKSDADDSPFAEDWFGSQKSEESLAKKKKPTLKKLKIFSTLKQEMKYKETLKQKVKKVKKAKKIKNYAQGIEPLKNSWRNRENISSRKSKTLRCYNSRKQDDNGSLTVCVTYPKSWGATAPYPYYYPFYYPAYYYYPYYYYGRR
ncbi:hypothetical protein MSG28_008236 [Choristoneura fumiferana]|uniref:Uncharacterized protein n=1 Tax=Choristoneura fumiferana TaxID=7141 RepID=A0ACC0JAN1_CHOFU|nr:hypothetical protein MSG28_008236 [Choristoneura fumiferana]